MSKSSEPKPPPEWDCSLDAILRGRLSLWQPRAGYRFSVDALLLADFVREHASGALADLGAGCGVVGLALAQAIPGLRVTLVELQARLAALCRINAAQNGLQDRVTALEADLRQLQGQLASGAFDAVVSNPPFRLVGAGRPSPDPERALATTELEMTLVDLAATAAWLLRDHGTLAVILPATRADELLEVLRAHQLCPALIRSVCPLPDQPAHRVLVRAVKAGAGTLVVAPPLTIHRSPGVYTAEAAQILGDA